MDLESFAILPKIYAPRSYRALFIIPFSLLTTGTSTSED